MPLKVSVAPAVETAPLLAATDMTEIIAIARASRPEVAATIEPAFTFPLDQKSNVSRAISKLLDGATSEILINTYALTDPDIIQALVRAKALRGLTVIAIVEPAPNIRNYRVPAYLVQNNIHVVFSKCAGFNNNSYIVIDRSILVTGGYQFTQSSAGQNAENELFIRHAKTAFRYYENFARHLSASVIPEIQLLKNPDTAREIAAALTRSL